MPELVMYAWFGLTHLPKPSRRGVRLSVDLVNAEWDSTSTESTQKTPTFTKILSFFVDSVDVGSHSALTQLIWSLNWRWRSWRGMRLRVNWVTTKCLKIRMSWRIQEQNRNNSEALLFGLYVFDKCKKREQKISCKCTFNMHSHFIACPLPPHLHWLLLWTG